MDINYYHEILTHVSRAIGERDIETIELVQQWLEDAILDDEERKAAEEICEAAIEAIETIESYE